MMYTPLRRGRSRFAVRCRSTTRSVTPASSSWARVTTPCCRPASSRTNSSPEQRAWESACGFVREVPVGSGTGFENGAALRAISRAVWELPRWILPDPSPNAASGAVEPPLRAFVDEVMWANSSRVAQNSAKSEFATDTVAIPTSVSVPASSVEGLPLLRWQTLQRHSWRTPVMGFPPPSATHQTYPAGDGHLHRRQSRSHLAPWMGCRMHRAGTRVARKNPPQPRGDFRPLFSPGMPRSVRGDLIGTGSGRALPWRFGP